MSLVTLSSIQCPINGFGLTAVWYARHGHRRVGVTARYAPLWYHANAEPAFQGMLTRLRRVLITAPHFRGFCRTTLT
jgi:hypothetical protein